MLAAVITLCQEAQAKRIAVVEHSCDTANVTFDMSRAKRVCRELGVPLISLANPNMYQEVTLSGGINIKTDRIATEILESDVYINLPIVKAHSATVTTVCLKNQMGTVWDRGAYHRAGTGGSPGLNLHEDIVGLAVSLRPTLNIVDATRILLTGAPKGPGKVEERHTVLVSADMVAADACAARLLGLKPQDIPYIGLAAQAGLGKGSWRLSRLQRPERQPLYQSCQQNHPYPAQGQLLTLSRPPAGAFFEPLVEYAESGIVVW